MFFIPICAASDSGGMEFVITQKYQFSMPLYRQEQEWKSIGIALSRANFLPWSKEVQQKCK